MYRLHKVAADAEKRVVHIDRLKPFDMSRTTEQAEALRRFNGGDDEWAFVTAVLDHRELPDGRFEFLVRWDGSDESTWSSGHNLRRLTVLKEYAKTHKLSLAAVTRT